MRFPSTGQVSEEHQKGHQGTLDTAGDEGFPNDDQGMWDCFRNGDNYPYGPYLKSVQNV